MILTCRFHRTSLAFFSLLFLTRSPLYGESFPSAVEQLGNHLEKKASLSVTELMELEKTFFNHEEPLSEKEISRSFHVLKAYDELDGALFLKGDTQGGYKREQTSGIELERVIFSLQQALIDYAYQPELLERNPELYEVKFKSSAHFPGECPPSKSPKIALETEIDATQIKAYGYPLNEDEKPVRRPTGWYLPPGEVATLSFPREMVNKGYEVRVGAHSWDLSRKGKVTRLDRVSLLYPIKEREVTIAHPLGGGIYIEVPWEAKGGIQKIRGKKIVESPFFSRRSFNLMTDKDWRAELKSKAPWADFETDRFMMQIPTVWAREMKKPEAVMAEYDKCLTLFSEIIGRPSLRSKSVLYMQVDTTFRGEAFFPGYPQSNFNWNPIKPEINKGNMWVIQGAHLAPSVLFHEMGHGNRFTKFKGEVEAVVNFPYVYVQNEGYGVDLDLAFGNSFEGKKNVTIDEAAISRMITENFHKGRPLNTSNKPGDEAKYQHRGYGIYADIAQLFGWEPLKDFWKKDQENYIAGADLKFMEGRSFPSNINRDPTDSRILRLSQSAGVDLTPLAYFWGKNPDDPDALARAMKRNKLKPSVKIYDRLVHYKTIIPMDSDAFLAHAKKFYPKVETPSTHPNFSNPNYGQGWYHRWLEIYNTEHGEAAQRALDKIINESFPDGRPEE